MSVFVITRLYGSCHSSTPLIWTAIYDAAIFSGTSLSLEGTSMKAQAHFVESLIALPHLHCSSFAYHMPEKDFEKMEEEEYESEEKSKGEWSDEREKSDKQKFFTKK
ncbi:hypothetical protein ACTXT7_013677 [Hymenolepis weldensis]